MSMLSHTNHTKTGNHGSAGSYIVGFILSLVFTIIPYYMVVNKSVAGNALIGVILFFGIIQMLIQIFFFLHLGRGPKPLYNIVFFVATAGMIIIVIGASLLIMNNLYRNMSPQEFIRRLAQKENISQVGGKETGACSQHKQSHIVVISNGLVSPITTNAGLCDTLTFVNEDQQTRVIAFGAHPDHNGYGGEFEVLVKQGRPETITLNLAGEYIFHDHLDPATTGSFTVADSKED